MTGQCVLGANLPSLQMTKTSHGQTPIAASNEDYTYQTLSGLFACCAVPRILVRRMPVGPKVANRVQGGRAVGPFGKIKRHRPQGSLYPPPHHLLGNSAKSGRHFGAG